MPSSKNKWRPILVPYAFLLPTLIVVGTFQFFPMIQAFFLSMWDYLPNRETNEFVGLANFARLLHDDAFWEGLKNSILYLLVVPMVIASALALALLVEPKISFIGFFRACYYVPVVTMMVVVAYAWGLIFNTDNGLLNQLLIKIGLIDEGIPWLTSEHMALWTIMTVTVWKGLGYYMIMFIVGLKAVPCELIEAARIDGANYWQTLCNVTLPMLWPTISLVSILSAISALQVFEEIYMMTAGRIGTTTIVYEIYNNGFDAGFKSDMGYACAIGVVLFGMLFIFSSIAIRSMDRAYRTE